MLLPLLLGFEQTAISGILVLIHTLSPIELNVQKNKGKSSKTSRQLNLKQLFSNFILNHMYLEVKFGVLLQGITTWKNNSKGFE